MQKTLVQKYCAGNTLGEGQVKGTLTACMLRVILG